MLLVRLPPDALMLCKHLQMPLAGASHLAAGVRVAGAAGLVAVAGAAVAAAGVAAHAAAAIAVRADAQAAR